ncbi:hypothetical protein RO575_13275 [Methylomonas sp. MO1]|uniref:hypothetical protein n=1 Tax=Methylomonas sp. MO1 TaxID=3073619 RepID=UPI0028A374EB|nr:hypothetical protein [Methylomonas sp. MO1]MDT4290533.1 hypothetical protein [Methylomonas sp. MO1]
MKNFAKIIAASTTLVASLAVSPTVFAHNSYNLGGYGDISPTGGTGGLPGGTSGGNAIAQTLAGNQAVWTNGPITPWLDSSTTLPSIGYLGLHNRTTTRIVETGNYCGGTTTADCVGTANTNTNSLLRQVYNYNHNAANAGNQLPTDVQFAVGANSWQAGVSAANTGLDFANVHTSTGSGNPEANLLTTGPLYLNITLADDLSDIALGSQKLAFSVYGGWAQGPGLTGLTLLTTQLAVNAGDSLGVSLALQGYQFNGAGTGGEYTIAIGDQSAAGGKYKLTLTTNEVAQYANNIVVASVPVPGAVWLFGSAMAGLIGFGRRKQPLAA